LDANSPLALEVGCQPSVFARRWARVVGGKHRSGIAFLPRGDCNMCRNIKPLFNFDPPATRNEMHDAALQFVRKISGYSAPSKANEAAFHEAVEDIEKVVRKLLKSLETNAPPKDREEEAEKKRERSRLRFGTA